MVAKTNLTKEQARFTNALYTNQEVFSLHDEDLGLCDWITHTIKMRTDMPVYLPHCTITHQLQRDV